MVIKMTDRLYGEYKNLTLDVYWSDVKKVYHHFEYFRDRAAHMLQGSKEGHMIRERFSSLDKLVKTLGIDLKVVADEELVPSDIGQCFFDYVVVDRFGLKPFSLLINSFENDKRFACDERKEYDDESILDLTIHISHVHLSSQNLDVVFRGESTIFGCCGESLFLKDKRKLEEIRRDIGTDETIPDAEINELAEYVRANI